jgi:ferredoxin
MRGFPACGAMPVIRFVREGRDVECYPGENLREVALREGVELYGLKGKLGNCGGCGQCITCFVEVVGESVPGSLSGRTAVEEQKLRRRPEGWRLACQALVQHSLLVLTRPQVGLGDGEAKIAAAKAEPLPAGPTAWPVVESSEADDDEDSDAESAGAGGPGQSATSGEEA